MPAIGMDQGPVAFTRWLQKYGGGGPPTANEEEWRRGEQLGGWGVIPHRNMRSKLSADCRTSV